MWSKWWRDNDTGAWCLQSASWSWSLHGQAMDQFLNLTVILFSPVKWVGNLPSRSHRILWLNQDLKTKRALHFSIIYTLSLCGRLWWVEWTPGLFNGEGLQYDSYPENYFIQHSEDFRNPYGLLEQNIKNTKSPNKQNNKRFKRTNSQRI